MARRINRRRFMKGVATVSGAMFVGPAILTRGQVNKDKLKIAFVGTDGRASSHVQDLNLDTDMCPCFAEADKSRWKKIMTKSPDAKGFTDYRQMFEKHEKDIDAVFVAIPDHSHACASLMALRRGKHVYCEKPLTWSTQEARLMAEVAASKKVATQMGNQGHANEGNRRIVEWVRGGLIGDITEVHTWTNRPIWPQGNVVKPGVKPVPETLDWEAWIGPAAYRDFVADDKGSPYAPFKWRGWYDFGCGAIGDMGCHTWDSVFWSLAPDYPDSVELLEINEHNNETFPKSSHFKWNYPAKGNRPAFVAHWYDGGLKPALPDEMKDDKYYLDSRKDKTKPLALENSGNLYIGTKGKLYVTGDYGNTPRIIPNSAMEASKDKRDALEKIPKSPGHRAEFVMAARGDKPVDFPGSNFPGYSGLLTENMLLGAIAQKIGQVGFKIECDPIAKVVKTPEALALTTRQYRKGFSLDM